MAANRDFQALGLNQANLDRLKLIFRGGSYAELVQDQYGNNWRAELLVVGGYDKHAFAAGLEVDDEFIAMSSNEGETSINVYPSDLF